MHEFRTLLRWGTILMGVAYLVVVVLGTLLAGAFRGRSEPPSPLAIVPGILLVLVWRTLGNAPSSRLLHLTAALATAVVGFILYSARGNWDLTSVGPLAWVLLWLVWYVLTIKSMAAVG